MHPSDLEPDEADAFERDRQEHVAEGSRGSITFDPEPARSAIRRQLEEADQQIERAGCMTERRRRSVDDQEADDEGDRYEAAYWKRGEG
jgi:hypothetical protein